ncbi:MAG: hypothetical protein ABDK94_00735 [Atribacterota bacterium]
MRWSSGILVVFISLVLTAVASGCEHQGEVPFVTVVDLPSHVGERVRIIGCLDFTCPTIPNAVYPRDCDVLLRQSNLTVPLEFPTGTETLREMLNGYYEAHFTRCVRLEVLGKVVEISCDVPECVPTIFIDMEDVTLLPE